MRRLPTRVRKIEMLWRSLYAQVGGGGWKEDPATDTRWPDAPQPPIRGRAHGLKMSLNLRDWCERRTYFTGHYYQRDVEELLGHLLKRGDQFIDIGANIGMISLVCAHLVGPTGRGLAFEPNPAVFRRLKGHIEENGLSHVEPINAALGDAEGTAELYFPGSHSGIGTLVTGRGDNGDHVTVTVKRGDQFGSRLDPNRPTLIKIDVEGYEYQVLQGMDELLARPETAVVLEVTDSMLRGAGASARMLYDRLEGFGYSGYSFRRVRGRWNAKLEFRKTDGPLDVPQYDAVFLRENSDLFRNRLRPIVTP
jgi:FkbM family methyltransferase